MTQDNTMTPAPPRSICVIRLSALGDVCHTVAMVRALQQAWPETAITWIIGKKEAPLVRHLRDIRFIVFDKRHSLSSFVRIRRALNGERFAVLVLAQTSLRANLLSVAVRADRRVGFGATHAKEGHRWFVNESVDLPERVHQAEALFSFAPHLLNDESLRLSDAQRALPVPAEADAFAIAHQPKAQHAVLISPCSSHRQRNWPAEHYATVADWVTEHAHRPVILIGGPSATEAAMGQAIEAACKHPVTNLIGQDTLDQALAMMARAACVITPDSGPAHMADGLGTPVVGVYAATRVARSGPWASKAWCVDGFADAAERFRGAPEHTLPWACRIQTDGVMAVVPPAAVIDSLKRLWGQSAR